MAGVVDKIRAEVKGLEGVAGADKGMGKLTFARPMKKAATGLYVQMWLQLAPDNVSALRSRLKLNEDVLRCQILRMPDEAFVAEPPVRAAAGDGGESADMADVTRPAADDVPQAPAAGDKEA